MTKYLFYIEQFFSLCLLFIYLRIMKWNFGMFIDSKNKNKNKKHPNSVSVEKWSKEKTDVIVALADI